jgi:sarcosine oxidase
MIERREFVVVGAGLVGLSVARELQRRGRSVVCLEQYAVGHEKAGSKGNARIFRFGYIDPLYVAMAMRALAGWEELSEEAGARLLEPTGLLSFGEQVDDVAAAMSTAGATPAWVQEDELRERFPGIAPRGRALYETTAGVLSADLVMRALAASVAPLVEHAPVSSIDDGGDAVRLKAAGQTYECGVVVLCGGPWSRDLARVAGIDISGIVTATAQQVAYLQPRPGFADQLPAFVERGVTTFYGLPVLSEGSYKVGIHDPGEAADPWAFSMDTPDPAALEMLGGMAARLLPGCDEGFVASERCFYDNTANEDFLIDKVGRVVIAAGTSGHGFKFGPVWGEMLADVALGLQPRFPIDRFSLMNRT